VAIKGQRRERMGLGPKRRLGGRGQPKAQKGETEGKKKEEVPCDSPRPVAPRDKKKRQPPWMRKGASVVIIRGAPSTTGKRGVGSKWTGEKATSNNSPSNRSEKGNSI